MGPQTPAQPPPGPSRASDLGSVDAAAAHDLPVGYRDLPRDPTGAAALFGDSDRYEWGLSEDTGLVGRRLADQFQDEEVLPVSALESGGSMQVDDDAFINAHRAKNDPGDLGNVQELGGAPPVAESDWNDLPSLFDRPVDQDWFPGTLVRWRSADRAPFGEKVYGLVTRQWAGGLKEEVDREAWRQGKICIHEGWETVWADPNDVIRYSQDTSMPGHYHITRHPPPLALSP